MLRDFKQTSCNIDIITGLAGILVTVRCDILFVPCCLLIFVFHISRFHLVFEAHYIE